MTIHKATNQQIIELSGLKITPHPSIHIPEFNFQYMHNREYWDKAFAFLRDTGLNQLPSGKYPVLGDKIYASVSENNSKDPNNALWEAHKKYVDIQYVIQGEEIIGVAPLSAAVKTISFDPDKDLGFYEIPEAHCKYYRADAEHFFIFFPEDAHRPCIRSSGKESEKKVVIKIWAAPFID